LAAVLLPLATLATAVVFPFQEASAGPVNEWSVSTPEEQGLDSVLLAHMLRSVHERGLPIHSLLVIRNGVLILEAYRSPYTSETLHELKSCTKSVISSLVGLALAQGVLGSIDRRLVECFPGRSIANLSEAKQRITLFHLLTMSGGFDWPGGMLEQPIGSHWTQSPDWVGFVLDRPLSDLPGTRFVYNSGGSHLLSAVLQGAAGVTAEEFAKVHLFEPLGLNRWYWSADPQGITKGYSGLWLRPRDLAKFGWLYLNQGRWGRRQVVPADWVGDSWRWQIVAGQPWLSDGYGFQWWIDARGYVMALGYGGQYLVLEPSRGLIMVALSGLRLQDFFAPEALFTEFVLPASESMEPLPANPFGCETLSQWIAVWASPDSPYPPPPLPDQARRISGRTFLLAPSPVGWSAISLTFEEGKSSAVFTADGVSLQVGLDGSFRATPPPPKVQAPSDSARLLRGRWSDNTTFVIEYLIVGRPDRYTETLRFRDGELTLTEDVYITGERFVTTGRASAPHRPARRLQVGAAHSAP
jgi:CubicO group peptidase (beta-lactamase class C family)